MDETLTPGQDASERADAEPLESLPGANRKRPHLSNNGQGVNMPQLREPLDGLPGAGRQLPHVSDDGRGVNHADMREPLDGLPGAKCQRQHLSNDGQGVNHASMREPLGGVKPKPPPGQTRAGFEKFPAPYFGGKSGAAAVIWQALGDVEHYVEPFCGSAAVLLARPHSHTRTYYSETINDIDGFIVNAFRAMAAAPEAVAEFAAWPVFEADLHARHQALIRWRHEGQLERLMGDPDWYDARIAGWWLWGQSCWIGSGWCSGRGPWVSVDGVLIDRRKVKAATKDAPGASRQRPHVSDDGQGVNMPKLREPLEYTHATEPPDYELGRLSTEPLRAWMRRLQDRLRWVRALNGDWKRAATNGAMNTLSVARMGQTGHCGVFLDPPYADTAGRAADVYAHDSLTVAHEVREWCLAHTDTPWLRVVLAGFEGEHNDPETGEDMLVRAGWRCVSWYGGGYLAGGMGNTGKAADGGTTSQQHRERLWLSPQCLPVDAETRGAAPADKAPAAVAGDEQLIFPVLLGGSV